MSRVAGERACGVVIFDASVGHLDSPRVSRRESWGLQVARLFWLVASLALVHVLPRLAPDGLVNLVLASLLTYLLFGGCWASRTGCCLRLECHRGQAGLLERLT